MRLLYIYLSKRRFHHFVMAKLFKKLHSKVSSTGGFTTSIDPNKPLPPSLRVSHRWIDNYFKELDKLFDDTKRSRKYLLVHWLITLSQVFNLTKNVVFIISDVSTKMRYILVDWSIFIGGVKTYQLLAFCSMFVWATFLHKLFFLTNNPKLYKWRQLFDMCSGKVCPRELSLTRNDAMTIKKLVTRAELVFKLCVQSFYNICKFLVPTSTF